MNPHLRLRILLFVPLCLRVSLFAAELPTAPILRIDPGMHTAPIRKIATDASGSRVLTCSDDKAAKLWSLTPGQPATLLRTFRIPIGVATQEARTSRLAS